MTLLHFVEFVNCSNAITAIIVVNLNLQAAKRLDLAGVKKVLRMLFAGEERVVHPVFFVGRVPALLVGTGGNDLDPALIHFGDRASIGHQPGKTTRSRQGAAGSVLACRPARVISAQIHSRTLFKSNLRRLNRHYALT